MSSCHSHCHTGGRGVFPPLRKGSFRGNGDASPARVFRCLPVRPFRCLPERPCRRHGLEHDRFRRGLHVGEVRRLGIRNASADQRHPGRAAEGTDLGALVEGVSACQKVYGTASGAVLSAGGAQRVIGMFPRAQRPPAPPSLPEAPRLFPPAALIPARPLPASRP